jgi:hypothetical protein
MNPSDLPCSFLNYWGYEFDLQGGGSMKNLDQPEIAASDDSPEVLRLKSQISALITENNRLRQQKTIVVERPRGQDEPYRDSVKEQQHNFFKYSNARRY